MRVAQQLTFLFILALVSVPSEAQVHFFRGYQAGDFNYGSSLSPGPDGTLFVAGGISTAGLVQDITVLTIAPNGVPLSIRSLDTDVADAAQRVLDLGNGRMIIGGNSGGLGVQPERDMVLVKTSATGTQAEIHGWGTPDSTEKMTDLIPYGGDLIVLGGTDYDDVDHPAFLLLRCDTSFNSIWGIMAHVGTGRHTAGGLSVAPDGSIYMVGSTHVPVDGQPYDAVLSLLKFNANGTFQWARSYDVPGNMYNSAIDIAVAGNGSVFLLQSLNGILLHVAENGELVWCKKFVDTSLPNLKFAGIQNHDGGIFLAGRVGFSQVDSRPVLMQCTPAGDVVWARKYGAGETTGDLAGLCIADTPEGPLALWAVGSMRPQSNATQQMLLMKVDLQGNGIAGCVDQELDIVVTDLVPVVSTPVVEITPYGTIAPQTITVAPVVMDLWTGCITNGVGEAEQGATSMFPNPTYGPCTIVLPEAASQRITVFDATGRRVPVPVTMGHGLAHVDLRDRESGVYLIHTLDAAGRSMVQRILKQ